MTFAMGGLSLSLTPSRPPVIINIGRLSCFLIALHLLREALLCSVWIGISSMLRFIFVEESPPQRCAFATTYISALETAGCSVGCSVVGTIYNIEFESGKWCFLGLGSAIFYFCMLFCHRGAVICYEETQATCIDLVAINEGVIQIPNPQHQ